MRFPLYVGRLDTERFTFEAIGQSEEEVRERLAAGFTVHLRDYRPCAAVKEARSQRAKDRAAWEDWADWSHMEPPKSLEAFCEQLEQWYGFSIARFDRAVDVLRDGDKL